MAPIHSFFGLYPKERKYRRFDLHFPVSLNLPSQELKAITRNVSIGGLLLNTTDYIPPHTRLTFTMEVRGSVSSRPVHLLGEGEVVRVEPLATGLGFAVAVQCQHPISQMEEHLPAAS
jgi:hypothetical protein